jgi:hypothetical protein
LYRVDLLASLPTSGLPIDVQQSGAATLCHEQEVNGALPRPRVFGLSASMEHHDSVESVGYQLAGLDARVMVKCLDSFD